MITIRVGAHKYKTKEETLLRATYFKTLFELNPQETYIEEDRDGVAFGHVLNYLRDETYVIPEFAHKEIEYYDFYYPKYSAEREYDNVTIIAQGVKFKCIAHKLIKGSATLADILCRKYVGAKVLLSDDPDEFKHVLSRIYDAKYVFPYKYRHIWREYEVQKLNLNDNYNFVEFRASHVVYKIVVHDALRSPTFKKELEENGFIRWVSDYDKGIDKVMTYCKTGDIRHLTYVDRNLREYFGV